MNKQHIIKMYHFTTKLAFMSLFTNKLFGFGFVIHLISIMCYRLFLVICFNFLLYTTTH